MSGKTFPKKIVMLAVSAVLLGAGVVTSANIAARSAAQSAPEPTLAKPIAKPVAAPAGNAGWIYREPGSPMPQSPVTKSVFVPRIQVAKDPRDGISVILPATTASVATLDSKGRLNYDCESDLDSAASAARKPSHRQ